MHAVSLKLPQEARVEISGILRIMWLGEGGEVACYLTPSRELIITAQRHTHSGSRHICYGCEQSTNRHPYGMRKEAARLFSSNASSSQH